MPDHCVHPNLDSRLLIHNVTSFRLIEPNIGPIVKMQRTQQATGTVMFFWPQTAFPLPERPGAHGRRDIRSPRGGGILLALLAAMAVPLLKSAVAGLEKAAQNRLRRQFTAQCARLTPHLRRDLGLAGEFDQFQ
jgi:hypothetical protein